MEAWIKEHEALAAWVETVGTLMALSYAVLSGQAAVARERRNQTRTSLQFVAMVEHVTDQVPMHFFAPPTDAIGISLMLSQLESEDVTVMRRLAETPLVAWPSPALYARFIDFATRYDAAISQMRRADSQKTAFEWDTPSSRGILDGKTPLETAIRAGWGIFLDAQWVLDVAQETRKELGGALRKPMKLTTDAQPWKEAAEAYR